MDDRHEVRAAETVLAEPLRRDDATILEDVRDDERLAVLGDPARQPLVERDPAVRIRGGEALVRRTRAASRVRPASSATQSPTAFASMSCAAARAISRRTWSRSSDEAMTPDSRASPWSRASRRSTAAFSSRSRSSSISGGFAAHRLTPLDWLRRPAPCIRSAGTDTAAASSPARAHAAQQYARPASTRQLHAGFVQPPAVASGAAAIPPGNFGVVVVGSLTARPPSPRVPSARQGGDRSVSRDEGPALSTRQSVERRRRGPDARNYQETRAFRHARPPFCPMRAPAGPEPGERGHAPCSTTAHDNGFLDSRQHSPLELPRVQLGHAPGLDTLCGCLDIREWSRVNRAFCELLHRTRPPIDRIASRAEMYASSSFALTA